MGTVLGMGWEVKESVSWQQGVGCWDEGLP